MKLSLNKLILLLLCFGFLVSACNSNNNLQVYTENKLTVVKLPNKYNNSITIQKIGFLDNNDTIWLTGDPVQENTTIGTNNYHWTNEQVTLNIICQHNGFHLAFKSDSIQATKWFLNISALEDEYFTGLFERVVDGNQNASWSDGITTALNLHGEQLDMKLKPTVSAYAPFYISSQNYGFYVETTWPGYFDLCKTTPGRVKINFEGPELNVKIYTAQSPLEIVQAHSLETGPSVLPPKWAFGPWRWRDEHFNKEKYYDNTIKKAPYNTDIVEDVLMMEALDIPATAHWIDRPWSPGPKGFDDYNFDENQFPDPEGMINWLNSRNLELMMWIGPFVMGDMAEYALAHNYQLESKTFFKQSPAVLMDFTNPDAVQWWGKNGPGKLAEMGIKGFKLDRADGEKLCDSLHLITNAGTTYRENYNDYPRQYVKATYDAVHPVLGNDMALFPRAQFTGSARYGAMWAGDTDGKPEGLRSAIIGMQRCAVMGYPLWGSDIGGYWGKFSRETTMRWIAFGCFSPIMETGPTNNLGFWSNPTEPYYDIELLATWRLYSKIRMKLINYLHIQAENAQKTGTPIALPLFLKYPEQAEAWNDWQTYLLGPDVLVSAIWEKENTTHRVYLPKGEIWRDAWDENVKYKGGSYVEVKAPLYKIPVFIREGSDIDLGDLKDLYQESMKKVSVKPDLSKLERTENWY